MAGGIMEGSFPIRIWTIGGGGGALFCGDCWNFYSNGFQRDSSNPNALEVLKNSSLRAHYVTELSAKPKDLDLISHGTHMVGEN